MLRCIIILSILGALVFALVGCDLSDPSSSKIEGLIILPENPTVIEDFVQQFNAYLVNEDGSREDVTLGVNWSISPVNMGTISPTGQFRGYLSGTCFITAEYGEYTRTNTVLIGDLYEIIIVPGDFFVPPIYSLQLRCQAVVELFNTLYDTLEFTDQVVYYSDDPTVLDVTSSGYATAHNYGSTTVVASAGYYHQEATFHVSYLDALDIVLPAGATVIPGDTLELTARATFGAVEQDVSDYADWQSSDPSIIRFCSSSHPNQVVILEEGAAEVTVSWAGVESDPVALTSASLASIEIAPGDTTVAAFNQVSYSATGHFNDGTVSDITSIVDWASSNPDIVVISPEGVATPVDSGSCVITASNGDVLSNAAAITATGCGWFENYDNGLIHPWEEIGNWFIDDGEYVVATDGNSDAQAFNLDNVFGDFVMEVEVTQASGMQYIGAGLQFKRSPTEEAFYFIVIWSAGHYRIGYKYGSETYEWDLITEGDSEAILQGFSQWNLVRIEADENQINLFINDQYVATAYHSALESGFVGYMGGMDPGNVFRFDNLRVSEVVITAAAQSAPGETITRPGTSHLLCWDE